MNSTKCPNCGASMHIETIGTLKDKILQCPYCEHQIDIPDSYMHSEEKHTDKGRIKTVTFRKDGDVELDPKNLKDFLKNGTIVEFPEELSSLAEIRSDSTADTILKKLLANNKGLLSGKPISSEFSKVIVSQKLLEPGSDAGETLQSMEETLKEFGFDTNCSNDNKMLNGQKTVVQYREIESVSDDTKDMPTGTSYLWAIGVLLFVTLLIIVLVVLT
jgi:DNA-directed RNA polymerase subunit M/transcription elongation factor TFIIS